MRYGEPSVFGEAQLISDSENRLPSVSFIIPAHNEARYLPATVRAIQYDIARLDLDAEVIVVNDASTDRTGQIALDGGARVVDVELRNIGAVRNAGAAAALHECLIFVDADTVVPAKTVQRSLQSLAAGRIGGGAYVEIPNRFELPLLKRWMYYAVTTVWLFVFRYSAGCYMYCRKDAFEDFGGFDEQFFAAEEMYFSQQLKQRGEFQLVRPGVLTSARKLHRYSVWELARFVFNPLKNPFSLFRSREGLEILYEDQR